MTVLTLGFIACKAKQKDKGLTESAVTVIEDTDALRYKIINNFKLPPERPDTILLNNEFEICRTDDGGEAIKLKMDDHPYIDSLSRKVGIVIIKKAYYDSIIESICDKKFHGVCPDRFYHSLSNNELIVALTAFDYVKDTSIVVYEHCHSNYRPFFLSNEYFKDKAGKWVQK